MTTFIPEASALHNNKQTAHIIHNYVRGEGGRVAQIIFECGETQFSVKSMKEEPIHNYVFVVETNLLCKTTVELAAFTTTANKQIQQQSKNISLNVYNALRNLKDVCFRKSETWWTYEVGVVTVLK